VLAVVILEGAEIDTVGEDASRVVELTTPRPSSKAIAAVAMAVNNHMVTIVRMR